MERIEELEKSLQEYRDKRVAAKREYLLQREADMEAAFVEALKKLVADQISRQTEGERLIFAFFICHLMSSYYTGSHELILGLSNSQIYLDEFNSLIYWKPPYLYNNIEIDMKEVKRHLEKNFIRLEEYELFRMKLKLLCDDWKLFEEMIPRLVQKNSEIIRRSSLCIEDELLILSGEYMERLNVIGHINRNID